MPRTLSRPATSNAARKHSPRMERLALPKLQETPASLIAVGAELKSTICIYERARLLFSGDLGQLTSPDDYRLYANSIQRWIGEMTAPATIVAHDLHPQYLSTRFARTLGLPTLAVQHHHAHIVAVMAEWGVSAPVIGICCDGAGYGMDGASWGCEVLHCDEASFSRVGHLKYFALPGGDAAALETWRPAAALLNLLIGGDWRQKAPPAFAHAPAQALDVVEHILARSPHLPMTSSLGRLFDAVSFMLGLCDRNQNEADAAKALERAAGAATVEPYPYETLVRGRSVSMSVLPMLSAILRDIERGRSIAEIASIFHETVARLLAATAVIACDLCGTSTVAISGGCFANRKLRERLVAILAQRHLRVLEPHRIPCGDSGISIGQAVSAAAVLRQLGPDMKEFTNVSCSPGAYHREKP